MTDQNPRPSELPPARILGIETSCDETAAAAVVENGRTMLSNVVASQADMHARYGGVFIQSKNLYYGLDFCPAFWDWLIVHNTVGRVFSIEKVSDEVEAGDDELASWAADRGAGFFVKRDVALLSAFAKVSARAIVGLPSSANR